jgi:hypothetical protein
VFELRLKRSNPAPGGQEVPDLPGDAQVWRDREGVRRAFGYTADGVHWIHLPGVPASFRFTSSGDGVEAIAAEDTSIDLVEDAYRRRVLPFALQAQGRELLHASAVELQRGAIAFCGASGAGKSTMASALSERGRAPIADDALLFETSGGAVHVHHLPFAIRLISEPGGNGNGPKEASLLVTEDHSPLPLRAVFMLDRTPEAPGPEPEIERLPRHEAFSLMLYHAHCFSFSDDDRRRRMLERYLELSAYVPAFRVHYRPSREELPVLLDAIEGAAG